MKLQLGKMAIGGLMGVTLTGCQTNPPPQTHLYLVRVEVISPRQTAPSSPMYILGDKAQGKPTYGKGVPAKPIIAR